MSENEFVDLARVELLEALKDFDLNGGKVGRVLAGIETLVDAKLRTALSLLTHETTEGKGE